MSVAEETTNEMMDVGAREALFGRAADVWQMAMQIARVFASDPVGCGGIWVQARSGPVRDAFLDAVKTAADPAQPWRRVPPSITDDRLIGGLDLAATLRQNRPVLERGLLLEANGGICILPMAERTDSGLAAKLAAAIDTGVVAIERDGFRLREETGFGLIALDEAVRSEAGDAEERLPAKLADRMAFRIDLNAVPYSCVRAMSEVGDENEAPLNAVDVRARADAVTVSDDLVVALCQAALQLGVGGVRAVFLALRVARIVAALDARTVVEIGDITTAAQLVLAPRATQVPQPQEPPTPENEMEPEELDETDNNDPPDGHDEEQDVPDALPEEVLLEAIKAAMPEGLLERLMAETAGRERSQTSGPAGQQSASLLRGRPIGTKTGVPRSGARLSLISTLRAAAPWQRLRHREWARRAGGAAGAKPGRVWVEAQDFRIRRHKNRSESVTIFAVDASGSAAVQRLAEAKGAVELLLAECYVRRDNVALVAFRGDVAEVLLPPTRSLVRAKRALSALPGGGGTPLASGLEAAMTLALAAKRRGQTPAIVVLTDGRGNVARDGTKGRAGGLADAMASAKALRAQGLRGVVVDTSRRPQPQAADLAQAMGALYLPMPNADAKRLSSAVGGFVAASGD